MPKGIYKRVLPPWNKANEPKTGERCAKCGSYYHTTNSHKEYRNSIALKYRESHRKELATQAQGYYEENKEALKHKRDELKCEVLKHYGNGKIKCVGWDNQGCPFDCSDIRCLSIDHTSGGGKKHREEIGYNLYLWLKKNNFPEGFTTLCLNCQWLKRVEKQEYQKRRIRL